MSCKKYKKFFGGKKCHQNPSQKRTTMPNRENQQKPTISATSNIPSFWYDQDKLTKADPQNDPPTLFHLSDEHLRILFEVARIEYNRRRDIKSLEKFKLFGDEDGNEIGDYWA